MGKRDIVLSEAQIEFIKALVGKQIVEVRSKLQYDQPFVFSNSRDIPDVGFVQSQLGTGLTPVIFTETDLVPDTFGGWYLPYSLSTGQTVLQSARIDYTAGGYELFGATYDTVAEQFNGFLNNNPQTIRIWVTGSGVLPPPTPPAPVFSLQPATPLTILQGGTLTLTVASSDTTSYQWYLNGVALSGETNSTLTVTNFDASKAGTYYVIALGPGGSANSANSVVSNDVGILLINSSNQFSNGSPNGSGRVINYDDGVNSGSIAVGNNKRIRTSTATLGITQGGTNSLTLSDGVHTFAPLVGGNVNTNNNAPFANPLTVFNDNGGDLNLRNFSGGGNVNVRLTDLSNNLTTIGVSIAFDWLVELEEIASGNPFITNGSDTLIAGTSTKIIYTYNSSIYNFIGCTFSGISPNPADGHNIIPI